MLVNKTAVDQQENSVCNHARKNEIEARISLLSDEIDANEEENMFMQSEIRQLEKELESLQGAASNAQQKK